MVVNSVDQGMVLGPPLRLGGVERDRLGEGGRDDQQRRQRHHHCSRPSIHRTGGEDWVGGKRSRSGLRPTPTHEQPAHSRHGTELLKLPPPLEATRGKKRTAVSCSHRESPAWMRYLRAGEPASRARFSPTPHSPPLAKDRPSFLLHVEGAITPTQTHNSRRTTLFGLPAHRGCIMALLKEWAIDRSISPTAVSRTLHDPDPLAPRGCTRILLVEWAIDRSTSPNPTPQSSRSTTLLSLSLSHRTSASSGWTGRAPSG